MRRRWTIVGVVVGVVVIVLIGLIVGGVFSSSSSDSPGSSGSAASLQSQLVGPHWKVASITTGGSEWKAPSSAKMELTFTDTTYTGSDGCNSVSGAVTYQTATITMAPGMGTLMACTDPDSEKQTAAFHALTAGPVNASVSGSTLTLTAGTTVVAFTKS